MEIVKKIYRALLVLASALFQIPAFRTFDKIVGNKKDKPGTVEGSTAVVTEVVTINEGQVRYSGSNWSARLSKNCSSVSISVGQEVVIESTEGIVLYVCPV